VFIKIIKHINKGSINIQDKVCNLENIKLKNDFWYYLYEGITKYADTPYFGHIPRIAYQYFLKVAKVKFQELLHYSKKYKYEMRDVIEAVSK